MNYFMDILKYAFMGKRKISHLEDIQNIKLFLQQSDFQFSKGTVLTVLLLVVLYVLRLTPFYLSPLLPWQEFIIRQMIAISKQI